MAVAEVPEVPGAVEEAVEEVPLLVAVLVAQDFEDLEEVMTPRCRRTFTPCVLLLDQYAPPCLRASVHIFVLIRMCLQSVSRPSRRR